MSNFFTTTAISWITHIRGGWAGGVEWVREEWDGWKAGGRLYLPIGLSEVAMSPRSVGYM